MTERAPRRFAEQHLVEDERFLLLDLSEVFGAPYSAGQTMRVRSLAPIQVMGVAVDAAGGATPILAG